VDRIRFPAVAAGLFASTLLLAAAPVAAQSEAPAASGEVVQVTGVEYKFTGLPTSLPAGTSLGLVNAGAEVHELVLVRIDDDVTATLEELLAMPEDPMEAGLVEMIGTMPLFAAPGETAEGTLPLEREGRYVVLCMIPQGLTDMAVLEQLGPDADPSAIPAEVQLLLANPPHLALGMIQEFTVTAAGSAPGPLPSAPAAAPASSPA
jgi:hypothetical protein